MTLHITQFDGGNAISAFRAQQLLSALEAIHPKITSISARFVHLVATEEGAVPALQERLSALLTYGDPFEGSADGVPFIVTPRMGTISPWASKATDIARNCGLDVFRVERITEYRVDLKTGLLGGKPELSAEQTAQIAALLHDRSSSRRRTRCWAYSTSRLRASCSRSTSSARKYQKAATMAAMNSSTAASGARAAKRSWRAGERLRHHVRHQRAGVARGAAGAGWALTGGVFIGAKCRGVGRGFGSAGFVAVYG